MYKNYLCHSKQSKKFMKNIKLTTKIIKTKQKSTIKILEKKSEQTQKNGKKK